jgi:outer membrane protein
MAVRRERLPIRAVTIAASAIIVTACARPEATHPQAGTGAQDRIVGASAQQRIVEARAQDTPISAGRYGDRTAKPHPEAETLLGALAKAYEVNPQLNAQRAVVRQIDEGVPLALADYRPRINAVASMGNQFTLQETVVTPGLNQRNTYWTAPRSVGLTAEQKLFNGYQTANRTRAAESNVLAARETLRVIEQTVLFDAATAYMDVVRDAAILEFQRSNVQVLGETLGRTRRRFKLGEVTRTDVTQAEAQLAAGRSQMLRADAALTTSKAKYRRVIGSEPGGLKPGSPVEHLLPRALGAAIEAGTTANPSVKAAMYGVDVAQLQVKVSEGALYPSVSLLGNIQRDHDLTGLIPEQSTATFLIGATIPLYEGGAEYATTRQSKETLAQRRLELATTRDQARAAVVQAWAEFQATKAQIEAAQEQVKAAEMTLKGMHTEARLGLRTTFDVLNAQQVVVNAQLDLATAQHDRVVGSYNLLSAIGRLSPQTLGLPTSIYDPSVHYRQVRDAWREVRTSDGR